ncbi:unnamed protein product [Closterium sp. NIES-65]|nr:unnamed protein product [Closterium sp. NIES-65]
MDTGDTSPCVLLFFERLRLVFNAGEGLQRLCIEHRIRLSKVGKGFRVLEGGQDLSLPPECARKQLAGCLPGMLLTNLPSPFSARFPASPPSPPIRWTRSFSPSRVCTETAGGLPARHAADESSVSFFRPLPCLPSFPPHQVDKIFLSRVCTETAGGLPGMLLTLANTGETGVTVDICGPSDLHRLAAAMRCFVGAASVRTSSFGSSSPGRQSYPHAPLPPAYIKAQQQQQGREGEVMREEQLERESGKEGESGKEQEDKSAYIVHDDGDVKITAVLLEPAFPEIAASSSSSAAAAVAAAAAAAASHNTTATISSTVLPSPSASFKELTLSQLKDGGLAGEGFTGVSSEAALPSATSAKRPSPSGPADVSSGWGTVSAGSEKRARVEGERKEEEAGGSAAGATTGFAAGAAAGVVPTAAGVAASVAAPAAAGMAAPAAAGMAAVVYVCELPTAAGKFDPKRAAAMGIRPGPKYRRLQMGESVASDDGSTMVHPCDVLEASVPGPVVLLIDCPTASHTQALLQSPQLQRFFISNRQKPKSDNNGGDNIIKGDNNGSDYKEVTVAVHVSPEAVVEEEQYRRWMGMLGVNTTHMLAGHGRAFECPPVLAGSAALTTKLHYVCPHLFPEPYDHTLTRRAAEAAGTSTAAAQTYELEPVTGLPLGPIVIAKNLLKVNLRGAPVLGVDTSAVPPAFNARSTVHHLLHSIPELEEASRKVAVDWGLGSKAKEGEKMGEVEGERMGEVEGERMGDEGEGGGWRGSGEGGRSGAVAAPAASGAASGASGAAAWGGAPACIRGMGREEVEVVFLGTGSSQPSKYRNLSGIYVHRFDRGGMILDCGEGSYAQLTRRFGPEKAEEIIAGLKCIWISHIHADHHTGLVRILAARRDILLRRAAQRAAERARPGTDFQEAVEKMESEELDKDTTVQVPPILVVGPKQLRRYLEAYQTFESLHLTFLDCSQTTKDAAALAAKAGTAGAAGVAARSAASARGLDGGMEEGNGREQCGLIWQKESQSKQQQQQQQSGVYQQRTESAVKNLDNQENRDNRESRERDRRGLRPFWLKTGFHLEDGGLDEPGRQQLGEVLSALGLTRLESVPVVHCPQAFAVVLEGWVRGREGGSGEEDSWKLVYSGDTRPCDTVRAASRGATVLIHEATFEDDLQHEAIARKHSTTSEAVEVGASAPAYRTILTHFSQRYPKIPRLAPPVKNKKRGDGGAGGGDAEGGEGGSAAIAFDLMSVNFCDLPRLPELVPVFQLLFRDALEEEEEEQEEGG